MTTELERKVVDAARDWLAERVPRNSEEKALFAALYRAYPEDFAIREECGCEDHTECDCDDCPPTRAALEKFVQECERDSMPIAETAAAISP